MPADALNDTARAAFEHNAELLATLDGWGTYASLLVPFSAPLDDDSLSDDHFALLPVEPPSPPVALHAANHPEAAYLELLPQQPLASSCRHLLAVRAGLRSGGVPVEPPVELQQDQAAQALVAEAAAALGAGQGELLEAVDFTWWFDVADHGIAVDEQGHQPHDMVNRLEDVRRQAGRYLASEGTVILGLAGP